MTQWDRAITALALLAIDPDGLGGVTVRARVGPARNSWMKAARSLLPAQLRLHPGLPADELIGGIDLTATLSSGTVVHQKGLLQRPERVLILPMAERTNSQLLSCLASELDRRSGRCLIALDEGVDDEALSSALADRLGLYTYLDEVALKHAKRTLTAETLAKAKRILAHTKVPPNLPEQLVTLAYSLGIGSLRAPTFALRAAKAHAALAGRMEVMEEDVIAATELVYAHRATRLPAQDEAPEPAPDVEEEQTDESKKDQLGLRDDLVLEAIKSALPPDLLSQLAVKSGRQGRGAGSGSKRIGNRRGRPLPARNTRATADGRVDLMATLRAAIPWQTLRKRGMPKHTGAIIRPEDLRTKRYQELSDRLLIFTVDASGSAALARLGEAKGAVELLLAEAYARRDQVALIAFRGSEADVLLPPTRSLVQTKRRLAALPGGGGTPTAAGLSAALTMAMGEQRKGMTPTVVLLTDGRSNIALDGSADRVQAGHDATLTARALAAKGLDALVIDTGNRPDPALSKLAADMAAPYVALPRADAKKLSSAVSQSLGG